jgi:hypothetical protein
MVSFEGSKIIGRRGFAFVSQNCIYWWEKNYKNYKDILCEVAEDREQSRREKDRKKSV